MAIVKVSELQGVALDWAVGKVCSGQSWDNAAFRSGWMSNWKPSTEWSHGGPLIEEYKPWLSPPVEDSEQPYGWDADIFDGPGIEIIGRAIACETPLIAICRAIVAAKLGDEIEVPDELIGAA